MPEEPEYIIPYICPECDNSQWVEVEDEFFGGTEVMCEKCGHTDSLKGPTR